VHIEAVSDGEVALERIDLLDETGGQPPDGVLLDLSLPKIDGIEVLQRIRRSPICATVPVLVLSGSDNPDDKVRMLGAGATRYLVKPAGLYAFLQVGAVVKEMLEGDVP
jgi:two-component system chemotaxis response regulator CheY